jgi:hypothetical protein
MEEILSSIRRIIADEESDETTPDDDDKPVSKGAADKSPLDALEVLDDDDDDDSSDVLELTSVIDEDRSVDRPVERDERPAAAMLELVDDGDDDDIEIADTDLDDLPEIADLADDEITDTNAAMLDFDDEPAHDDEIVQAIDVIETTTSQEDEPVVSTKKAETEALLSTGTASTTTGAFAKLSKAFRPTPVEESVADGAGRTVEQFIEDMARPMLKEWLDENMPAIVERLVQKEIQKIARRAELL